MMTNAARSVSLLLRTGVLAAAVSQAHAAPDVSCTEEGDCTRDLGTFTVTGSNVSRQTTVLKDDGGWASAHPGLMTVESSGSSGAVLSFDPDYYESRGSYGEEVNIALFMSNLSFEAKAGYRLNEVRVTVEGEVGVHGDAFLALYKLGGGTEIELSGFGGKDDVTVPFNISRSLAPDSEDGPNPWSHLLLDVYGVTDYGQIHASITKVSYQVSVSAVPEPSAWVLASVGMVLARVAARRTRRVG